MKGMEAHEQVWVKVNARVDRGVREIVAALSLFPDLQTIESCEGNPGEAAWLCFSYGSRRHGCWEETASFVLGFLAPKLHQKVGDSIRLTIRACEYGDVLVDLSVRHGCIPTVAQAIADLANDFSACQPHSSGCSDDTSGTSRGHYSVCTAPQP